MSDDRYQAVCRPGAYEDIRSRLGEPSWWDGAGVPRYGPFKPDALACEHDEVALVEIRCQACDEAWQASMGSDASDRWNDPWSEPLSVRIEQGFLYWDGGPPGGHACGGGESLSVAVPRVMEFWRKERQAGFSPTSWLRIRQLERVMPAITDLAAVGDAKARQLIELGQAADVLLREHHGCGSRADEKVPSCATCLLGRALQRTRVALGEALKETERKP